MVLIKLDVVSLVVFLYNAFQLWFHCLLVMIDGIYNTYPTRNLYLESHCNCIFY